MPDNMDNSQEIKVSVCVVTYNQEKYIAECLLSLLSQKTTFKYEIIVGEDCSADNTREIIENLYTRNPGLIVKNFHTKNIGAVANAVSTYKMAKGKYICHMDGDDYALPGKLQAQYDALEANPDCVICSHDMIVINSAGRKIRASYKSHRREKNTLMHLLEKLPFFAHSSKMFRNKSYGNLWNELDRQAIDIEIHVAQAKHGNIHHINKPLGAYRVFTGISTQTAGLNPIIEKGSDRVFEKMISEYPQKREEILKFYANKKYNYAYQAALRGDKINAIRLIKESKLKSKISVSQAAFYILSKSPSLLIATCKCMARLKNPTQRK